MAKKGVATSELFPCGCHIVIDDAGETHVVQASTVFFAASTYLAARGIHAGAGFCGHPGFDPIPHYRFKAGSVRFVAFRAADLEEIPV